MSLKRLINSYNYTCLTNIEATDLSSIIQLILSLFPHICKLSHKFRLWELSTFLAVLKRCLVRRNKYSDSTSYYFDFLSEKCIEPHAVDNELIFLNFPLLGKMPQIIIVLNNKVFTEMEFFIFVKLGPLGLQHSLFIDA